MRLLCRKYNFLENSKNLILVKTFFLDKQKNTCLFIVDKEPKKNYFVQICDIDCQSNMEWPICNICNQRGNNSKLSYILLLYIYVTCCYNFSYSLQKTKIIKNVNSNNYVSTKFLTQYVTIVKLNLKNMFLIK